MNMDSLKDKFNSIVKVIKVSDTQYEIISDAKLTPTVPIKAYLIEQNGRFYLSDQKETLKFMNKMYELTASDVKQCINDVLKHYKFQISNGVLLAEIKEEQQLQETYFYFIMCIAQLVNMFIFFDKP